MPWDIATTFEVPQADQLVELTWPGDTSNASPSTWYVPWLEPIGDQPDTPAVPIQPYPISVSTEPEQTWRPTLQSWPNQPSWVTERNCVLQNLLDSATPLFAYGADIGTPMCQVCTEHFAKLQLDVDSTWTQPEIKAKRANREDASGNQVWLSDFSHCHIFSLHIQYIQHLCSIYC
jgi:hypothetical protein